MKRWAIGLAATVLAPLANATIHQYEDLDVNMGNGGHVDGLFAEYDTDTSVMTWSVDNLTRAGSEMDGFWLVTNNGPDNPKGDDGLAIFYADFNSSSIWAFAYNGENNPSSYSDSEYLGDFSAGIIDAGTTRGFSLDVSSIYASLPTSSPFDDEIGIWFHATFDTDTETNTDGRLTDWDISAQSWYDRSGQSTTEGDPTPDPIPVPATLPLLVIGLLGLRRMQKVHS